jgi:uncharacterized protein
MKIIISGGTGLIGSPLAASLAQDGHQVIVLSRNPQAHSGHLPQGVQTAQWDGRTAEGWGSLVDGADAVVNLAAENIGADSLLALIFKRWTPERRGRLLTSRIDGGHAMLEAIQKAQVKPRVLVQASAVGYYGSRGDEELTEESAPGDDFLASICTAWEASTAAVEKLGVRHVILRSPGVVMSLAGGSFPFMVLPFKLFIGGPLGSGKQWLSWIHIQDEVKAIRFLIDRQDASGAFNLAAPQATTNAEFSKVLGKVMGRPSFIPVPEFALKLLFGARAVVLVVSTRQIPKKLQELGFIFDFPTAQEAIADVLKKK